MPDTIRKTISHPGVPGRLGPKAITLTADIPKDKVDDKAYLSEILKNEYNKKYGRAIQMNDGLSAEVPGSKQPLPPSFGAEDDFKQAMGGQSVAGGVGKFIASPLTSIAGIPGQLKEYFSGERQPSGGFMGEGDPFSQAYNSGLMALGPPDLATGAEGVARGANAVVGGLKGGLKAVTNPEAYRTLRVPMMTGGAIGEILGMGHHSFNGWAPGAAVGGAVGLARMAPDIFEGVKSGMQEANPPQWNNSTAGPIGPEVMDNMWRVEHPRPSDPLPPSNSRPTAPNVPVYDAEWAPDFQRSPGVPPEFRGPPRGPALPPGSEGVNAPPPRPNMSQGAFEMGTSEPGTAYSKSRPGAQIPDVQALSAGASARSGQALPMPPAGTFDITGTMRNTRALPPAPGIPMPPAEGMTPQKLLPAPTQFQHPTVTDLPSRAPMSPNEVPTVAPPAVAKPAAPPAQAPPAQSSLPSVPPPVAPKPEPMDVAKAAISKSQAPTAPPVAPVPEVPKSMSIAKAAIQKAQPVEPEAPAKAEPSVIPREPIADIPVDLHNRVLDWMKKRRDFTAAQVMTEFGIPGETARSAISEMRRRGLVSGVNGKYNYNAMKGEPISPGDVGPVKAPEAKVENVQPVNKPPINAARQAKIDAISKSIQDMGDEFPEASKVLKGDIDFHNKLAKLEATGFKSNKALVDQVDNTMKEIDRLESKDMDHEDLPVLYRQLSTLQDKVDNALVPDKDKYGDRVANLRSIHDEGSKAGLAHKDLSDLAKIKFNVDSMSKLTPEQLSQFQDELRQKRESRGK